MIWPSRADVNGHMPEGFKKLYPSTRVILDCTEMFVQTSTSNPVITALLDLLE